MHSQLPWQHLEPEKWKYSAMIWGKGEAESADNLEHRRSSCAHCLYISGAPSHLPAATVNAAISNKQHCGNLPSRDATVEAETVLLSNTRGRERSSSMAAFSSRLLVSNKSHFTLSLHLNATKSFSNQGELAQELQSGLLPS